METETKLRSWGNSIGIVLPKDRLKKENLTINDEVKVIIRKKTNPLKEVFGKLKEFTPRTKKTTEELLKEVDNEFKSRFEE